MSTDKPAPWTYSHASGYIVDARGDTVCDVSMVDDPETRAVLLHAGEMFAAIKRVLDARQDSREERDAEGALLDLGIAIESEIAAGIKP